MTATRVIDDHIELANIGAKTHAEIESHIQGIGNYAFPVADGSANQILETDGADVLSWVDKPSGFACGDLSSCNLTDIGTRAHSSLTGIGTSDHHVKFTDQNAVDACDASNKFIERNVVNAVTGATTLERNSLGTILGLQVLPGHQYMILEGMKLICKDTGHTTTQMMADVKFPYVYLHGSDGLLGYAALEFKKTIGSNDIHLGVLLRSGGTPKYPATFYHNRIRLTAIPIENMADPTNAQDATTKNYVDTNKYTDAEARASISDIFGADGKADVDIDLDNHAIKNIKNHVHSALSGTKKLIELDISGVPYYFEVSPTKA